MSNSRPKVIISGACIAGPALARWLGRNGFEVTVVEKAPTIRPGGQAVDFKGRTHMQLLKDMGICDDVFAAKTSLTDWRVVDANNVLQAVIPGEFLGGNVEILRGDLTNILHRHSMNGATYVFGDEIKGLEETDTSVKVEFAHRPSEHFDLVIGCDGVHSAVRRLAFGPEEEFITKTGYYYAVASTSVSLGDLETSLPDGRAVACPYNEPCRFIVIGNYDRKSTESQVAFLRKHFEGSHWLVPEAIKNVGAGDFYMDALAQSRMTTYTRGRFALVGDAGYANTLGGFGSGLALLAAYVLAGELVKVKDTKDWSAAYAAYDRIMAKPTAIARSGSAGAFLAPASNLRIRLRNLTISYSWPRNWNCQPRTFHI